jgi:threonine/homoserine/homoserine lactone efflux protein
MTQPSPQPGWYPDPSGTPGQRYWDGQQWTHRAPPPPPQPTIVINNTVGAPAPMVVTTGPNHALHLVLTLLTFGMWLPVWLIVAVAGGRRMYVGGQPARSRTGLIIGGLLGGLFLLSLAISHSQAFLGIVALMGLGYLGYRAYERAIDRRAEQAKIAARADTENQAFMFGDSSGYYGQYPPTQPPDPR